MSAKKRDMSAHEPSWAEVILGAVLSVALGGVLGIVLLAIKPSAAVKEIPADAVKGTIYYVQGSHDSAKGKSAAAKRKQFAQGAAGTMSFTEDEINSFLPPPPPLFTAKKPAEKSKAADKKDADKKAPAKAAAKPAAPGAVTSTGDLVTVGAPNFHLHDGKMQIAVPAVVSVLGLDQDVMVVADGTFVKKGDKFTFVSDTLYLGSCPIQRVPFAAGFVAQKFIGAIPVPEDVAAAWPKLTDVAVEGNVLKLTMP